MMMVESCSYSLKGTGGNELAKGQAGVQLEKENISILPKLGEAIYFQLIDIISVSSKDYKVSMRLTSDEELTIFDLGYRYEDFIANLFKLRNEMMIKYLLMEEPLRKSEIHAKLRYVGELGKETQIDCELRLYETSLIVLPITDDPIRIPFGDISQTEPKDYSLTVSTELGERFVFSAMGSEFDNTVEALSESMNVLTSKSQSTIKDLLPAADPLTVRKVSRFLKEGRAAKKSDIEPISDEFWNELERKIASAGLGKEYDYLKSLLKHQSKLAIGLKRGLMGDLTGDYIWILVPIYDKDPKRPGNVIALESAKLESSIDAENNSENSQHDSDLQTKVSFEEEKTDGAKNGNATYFFRIMPRGEYSKLEEKDDLADLHTKVDNLISRMNRLMLDINFRREPIYLTDDRLKEEKRYQKYRYAAAKIPSLQTLRSLFIGRVIHSSFEQWKRDVSDLLAFNVSTQDDNLKWHAQ